MKLKNLYMLIAREVTTDSTDGLLSVIKIIDKFTFDLNRDQLARDGVQLGKQEIGLPVSYGVATSWVFSEKSKKETFYTFRLSFFDPNGKKLSTAPEQENLLPPDIEKFNMNFNIQGLTVTKEGKYKARAEVLSKEGESLAHAEYPFEVVFNLAA